MKKVYKVWGCKYFSLEVVADSIDEAVDIANEKPLSEWETDWFEIQDAELLSSDASEWFGPDRSDEI